MKKKLIATSFIFLSILLGACFGTHQKNTAEQTIVLYQQGIAKIINDLNMLVKLIETNATTSQLQDQFKKARGAYKELEWLSEYYYPFTVKYINGPALEDVDLEEKNVVIPPEGFQVLETYLFPSYGGGTKNELLHQARVLASNVGRLQQVASNMQTTDAHIFDALRLEVFRIMTLGISGFDSPLANNSISEAASSLKGVQDYYSIYEEQLEGIDKSLTNKLHQLFNKAQQFLSVNNNFVAFDRMTFITQYLDPISAHLFKAQQKLGIPFFTEPRAIKANAKTLFDQDIFNPDFFTAGTDAYSNEQKIALGKKLFFDGVLSGDGKRTCATCHNPAKAFTDGLTKSNAVTGGFVQRNAPTLLYAALQQSQFYDLRSAFLEDQAKDVIENKHELHGSLDIAARKLSKDSAYIQLFRQAFSKNIDSVRNYHIQNALAAYIRSLTPFNSRFDRHMRGEERMNKEEIEGFNLFMGKAKCGTCHFMPLFNGTVPPSFTVTESEVIGVPGDKKYTNVDKDKGRYNMHQVRKFLNAFKTPTVRNIQLTAPYMHNGVFSTLQEVVDFYDGGGAAGRNLALDNQTLPADSLHLDKEEKRKLVLFMNTLTDDRP